MTTFRLAAWARWTKFRWSRLQRVKWAWLILSGWKLKEAPPLTAIERLRALNEEQVRIYTRGLMCRAYHGHLPYPQAVEEVNE